MGQDNLVSLDDCLAAINEKLAHRGKKLDEIREEFYKKEARLKKNLGDQAFVKLYNCLNLIMDTEP